MEPAPEAVLFTSSPSRHGLWNWNPRALRRFDARRLDDLTPMFDVCYPTDMAESDHHAMEYVHRLPGRLRVRSEALKRNPKRGSEVLTAIGMLPGVHDVDVNIATGSVLVHFDPVRVSADTVFEELLQRGVAVEPGRPHVKATPLGQTSVRGALAKAIATAVIQHAFERSVGQIVTMLL